MVKMVMRNTELIQAIHKIFSLDSDWGDVTSGLNIKNAFCPRKIYKFRALSRNAINNVINNDIWFDNPTNMNDPYDCKFMWDNWADRNFISAEQYQYIYANKPEEFDPELFEYISNNNVSHNDFLTRIKIQGIPATLLIEILKDRHEKMVSDTMNTYLKGIYFCSFSENFTSILMWTHYSKNHSGFCIEYDLTGLNEDNPYIRQLYPVIYTDKLFNVSDFFYGENGDRMNKEFNNLYFTYPLIYKSYEWDYEKEWRVIHPFKLFEKAQNLPTPPISYILLGSNFFKQFELQDESKNPNYDASHSLAFQLISHCEKNNIKLKIMKHSLLAYSMTDTPISYDDCYKLLSIKN